MRIGSWSVPTDFVGKTVAVMASGPSMTAELASRIHRAGMPAIVVNSTFRLAPWAWMLYAADGPWWDHRANDDVDDFAGLKVRCSDPVHMRIKRRDVQVLRNTGPLGFDPTPGTVRTGSHSGYQAVHVALQTRAQRVLLFGFDMRHVDGMPRWHGEHPKPLRQHETEHLLHWARKYEHLRPVEKQLGCRIFNCTPGSSITAFASLDPEEALNGG